MTPKVVLELHKGERLYQFILANDSPLGECMDALDQWQQHIVDLRIKAKEKMNEDLKNSEGEQPKAE